MRTVFVNFEMDDPLKNKSYTASPLDSVSYGGFEYDVISYEKKCKNPYYALIRALFYTTISLGIGLFFEDIRHLWHKGITSKNIKKVYIQQKPVGWDDKFLFNRDDPEKSFDAKLQKAIQKATKCFFERINIASFRKNSRQVDALFAIDGVISEHIELPNNRVRMDFMRFPKGKCLTIIAPQDNRRMRYWNSNLEYKLKSVRTSDGDKKQYTLFGRYIYEMEHKLYVMSKFEINYVKMFSSLPSSMMHLIREGEAKDRHELGSSKESKA